MKKMMLVLCAVVSVSQFGAARSETYYDWQTGNQYVTRSDSFGNKHVQGFNVNTGTLWNADIDHRGNERGFDGGGNFWTYNRQSNTYINYGTGQVCTGEGYARTCQ